MALVDRFGEMWARNRTNISLIPGSKQGGQGVYILYDGSMPVYIGKGNIRSRIRGANRSERRGEYWDYFSWYTVSDPVLRHDLEVLLLRKQPWYLRGLNRQDGHFTAAKKLKQKDKTPRAIR